MGFNRLVPRKDAPPTVVICRFDTAIPIPEFPAEYVAAADEALKAALDKYEALSDEEKGKQPFNSDLVRFGAIAEAFLKSEEATDLGLTTDNLKQAKTEEELIRIVRAAIKSYRWKQYEKTGNEEVLGELGPDPLRWQMQRLGPDERVHVLAVEEENGEGSKIRHSYAQARWILERTLVGCEGWQDYKNDNKTGKVSKQTLDILDPDWAIWLANFIFRVTELRTDEKKA